jgi:hypothetical protein
MIEAASGSQKVLRPREWASSAPAAAKARRDRQMNSAQYVIICGKVAQIRETKMVSMVFARIFTGLIAAFGAQPHRSFLLRCTSPELQGCSLGAKLEMLTGASTNPMEK